MTDLRHYSREFIIEFIELYRSYPCLWKIISAEYSDSDERIDSLRGCFRKELKKVNASKKSGSGTDDVYKPNLWYYEYLLFLTEQETPRDSVTNIGEESHGQDETSDTPIQSPTSLENLDTQRSVSSCSNTPSVRSSITSGRSTSRKPIRDKADDVLEKASAQLDISEDKFDISGKNIANKLRDLPRDAAVVAEKLITDVLFDAAMGNITRHTKMSLTSELSQQQQFQSVTNPHIESGYGSVSNQKQRLNPNTTVGTFLSDFSPEYLDL